MPSYTNTRFTLMAFPQGVDDTGLLSLNIVFIPRNISPLEKIDHPYPGSPALPFAEVQPEFTVMVVNNPDEFPGKVPANERGLDTAPLAHAPNLARLYMTLKQAKDTHGHPKYFDIDENRSTGRAGAQTAPAAIQATSAVKKYLPLSYRGAFNFTAPRTPNAVIDDSYRCAIRDNKPAPPYVPDKKVSWGKVYAHLLRQKLLATRGGLLYTTTVQLADGDFAKGGWIYLNIKAGSTYSAEQAGSMTDADGPFIARYAARIPMLRKGEARRLFAPVLFPVMHVGESPSGKFDDLYVEAGRFNDGFATIVHANQPVSHNLLQEEPDGFHPQKEMGVRLGWEDEQILIWYLRQLSIDESVGTDRLDAPIGVNGFHVDVRRSPAPGDPAAAWESLTAVESNGKMYLEGIEIGDYKGELPFQVYPVRLDSAGGTNYWLPVYFGSWNDASMVLPDRVASSLYANDQATDAPVTITDTYKASDVSTRLRYGSSYDFRVRLSDISGGGPDAEASPLNDMPAHVASIDFKRYVAPNTLRIIGKDAVAYNTGEVNFDGDSLELGRPLLGFPTVVYTGKYVDPVGALLKASKGIIAAQKSGVKIAEAFGIPDPDVVKVELKVEVETLQLDNLKSDDGREHYITLYRTCRSFPASFTDSVTIPVEYVDVPRLDFSDTATPFNNPALDGTIGATSGKIVLPTARNIRLTLRAVCEGDATYWGSLGGDPDGDSRYGKKTVLSVRRPSGDEHGLFIATTDPKALQGVYLQPDQVAVRLNPLVFKTLQGTSDGMPDIVQRLAKQLDVECKEMTLLARNGERLQFWCSNLVRHSMAPDNSSLTFANRKELAGHWFVCTTLVIDRDWCWDGLETGSFTISRRRRWSREAVDLDKKPYDPVGDLELRRIASFQAIQAGEDGKVHREYTRIILVDVIDMQPAAGQMPDTLEVQYCIEPSFRKDADRNIPAADAGIQTAVLPLPTTVNPVQVPKLVGAGTALSPYVRNVTYSATEPRHRYLWLEFDSPPSDPDDDLFCRVLAYAPDQLLSNNHPDLMGLPSEPSLPIDPEYVRMVTPASAYEHSGLNAMQKLEKSIDGDRQFYLLPLPSGLHPESPELFGMFTYEFRYGHSDRIWSTAQARFGRKLRVTGLQHPAPNLHCMVTRSQERICVSAPYARAVAGGRNVTADPPRTSLWCLLYAQVRQADGLDFRNILLAETRLKPLDLAALEAGFKRRITSARRRKKPELVRELQLELSQLLSREKEMGRSGYGCWSGKQVRAMLELYGLPLDSPLSVLGVEVYGQITRLSEHIDGFSAARKREMLGEVSALFGQATATNIGRSLSAGKPEATADDREPLGKELGHFRILRTSPLTEVPFICCSDCGS